MHPASHHRQSGVSVLNSEWQGIFQSQVERLVAAAPSHPSIETPEQTASSIIQRFLDGGLSVVEETRTRLTYNSDDYPQADDVEPMLGLIQLFSGAIYAIAEADLSREELGITSIFSSAPRSSRYALIEIVKAARAVLVLSSRALDVQAVVVLRQAWELAARSILLASDTELASRFEALAVANTRELAEKYAPDPELGQCYEFTIQGVTDSVRTPVDTTDSELSARFVDNASAIEPGNLREFENQLRNDLRFPDCFRRLADIERTASRGTPRHTGFNKAHRRFEALYGELSHFTHGGPHSAFVSEWSWGYFYREETLPDGISGPTGGEEPWHFMHLTRQLFLLLDYFVWLYPAVEFSSGEPAVMRRFFEDWLDWEPPVWTSLQPGSQSAEFESEYRLYVGLEALSQLGLEYHAVVFGEKE